MRHKSRTTILIIEGEKLFADLLTRELSTTNAQTFSAVCVDDARDLLKESLPDVCVVDLALSNLSGFVKAVQAVSPQTTLIGLASASDDKIDGINTVVPRNAGLPALLTALRPHIDMTGEAQILVVDDDQEIRDMLSEFLTSKGYNVLTAPDGNEAVQLVGHNRHLAVVLLDLHMPGKGGMEALKELRRVNSGIEVIMITALADREIAQQAITLGAFDYVIKPFDMNAIETVVSAGISRAELRGQSWWRRLIR